MLESWIVRVGICLWIVLGLAASVPAQLLGPRDLDAMPSRDADARVDYGEHEKQFGDLRLPSGEGPFPVAVVIHGGCWISKYADLQNSAAFADALREVGVATWNIEYRPADIEGGGWPGTFRDVAAATDHLRQLATDHPLDLDRVLSVGHSAGGHLALWLAARSRLPKASELHGGTPLVLRAAVALGGPGDLRDFVTYGHRLCGGPVIHQLLGGDPEAVPERYDHGSPVELLPMGTRQVLIAGSEDPIMPERALDAYVAAALEAGDMAEAITVPEAGHFEVLAPGTAAWDVVSGKIVELLGVDSEPGEKERAASEPGR